MRDRSQVSLEYVLVVVFVMVLILPGAYLFFTASVNNHDAQDAEIQKSAQAIIAKASDVYAMGAGAKAVVNVQLPSGISSIETRQDSINGAYELAVITPDLEYYFRCPPYLMATLPFEGRGQGIFLISLEAKKDALGDIYVLAGFAEN
jgi:uncharacterized protein (UPF0333 family)